MARIPVGFGVNPDMRVRRPSRAVSLERPLSQVVRDFEYRPPPAPVDEGWLSPASEESLTTAGELARPLMLKDFGVGGAWGYVPIPMPGGGVIKGVGRGIAKGVGKGADEVGGWIRALLEQSDVLGDDVLDEVAGLTQRVRPASTAGREMIQMSGGGATAGAARRTPGPPMASRVNPPRPVGVGAGPIVKRADDLAEARRMNIAPPADDVVFRTEATMGPLQRRSFPQPKPDAQRSGSEWISTGDGTFSRFSTRPAGTGGAGFVEPKAGWHKELDYVFAPEDVAYRIKANPTQISDELLSQTSQTPRTGWHAVAIGATQDLTHVSDEIVWVKPQSQLRAGRTGRFPEPALGTTPRTPATDPRRVLDYGSGSAAGHAMGLHGPQVGGAGSAGDLIAEMLRLATYGS